MGVPPVFLWIMDTNERYQIVETIAQGDFATVYRARDQELAREVAIPQGLTIEPVANKTDIDAYVRIGRDAFGMCESAHDGIIALESALGWGPELPWRRYLARLDGEPVATSLLILAAGVAGIYWIATAQEARGKGIGSAITHTSLLMAREMGYRATILQASASGLGLYKRLGFRQYTQTNMYIWG